MKKYILNRLISMIIVLFIVATLTFFLAKAIPGGPFTKEKKLPDAVLKNLEKKYNLDAPLWKQYTDYMLDLLKGDLGPSFRYDALTVNDIIKKGFPVSALLGFISILLAIIIGIPAGVISSLKQNSWRDNIVMFFSILGISIPNFILATLLMYIFGLKLGILPIAGWGNFSNLILPSITLAAYPTAFIARMTRSSMLEVLSQDYIKTARSKGLSEYVVIFKHGLKNAILPVVTYLGPLIAAVFTGSFVVERLFFIPGLGRYYVTSIYDRDYTVILGTTIFYAAFLVFANFIVDIVYAFLDPRITYTSKG
ncbi:MAG TPA: ABC transporter permease [Caldisericia bacterium]|nr:ABC transporter permease [Caldisericia bacterium]HQL66819.1 ABC transporter permease [Caldisericia bacterium]HQN48024.1 ABC transporter permease [Caldisericia bacterium]HQO99128.1 ABC transporter permease [Caldisericia bacterium]